MTHTTHNHNMNVPLTKDKHCKFIQTPPTYKCPHSHPCYFLSTDWPTVWVLSHCRASSRTAQFPLFSSKQPNAPSMAMRKIGVGTLVSVEQESTGRGRRRPSEGGIGFVVKRKKQRRMEDKNGETPVVELTQQSTTSTTTAGTGATMFDIRYSLDGRLSQEVNKNRVRVGMLGTTARQRNGSREIRPSLLTASTTTTTTTTTNNNNNNTSHNDQRSVGLKKYTHQWLLVAMDHKTRDSEQKHRAALQHKKRTNSQGWLRQMEAHHSVTNVKDDCLFPALSKHISREQGINKGSQIFTLDELWAAVKKCWHNFPLDSLARGYVRHAQMASALVACNGGDDFVREHGGLHYNIRICCATVCGEDGKPMGVEVLTCYDDSEEEEDDDKNNNQKLRYEKPNVEEVVKENLQRMTSSEVYTLFHELPQEHPWFNDVMDAFLAFEASMEEDNE